MAFTFPLAFFGLLAVPALVAIYWLRSKHRRQTVSSLMLWVDQRQPREGGLIVHRFQTPLLFFLELLAILLLVLAAAGPTISARDTRGPLVIILDDSFSMLNAKARAEEAIREELRAHGYSSVRLVLARETPSLIGEPTSDADRAIALLTGWKCFEPSANLDEAIAFSFAVSGASARLLVVTDHPPAEAPQDGRLEWRAFGRASPNLAFVNATRNAREGRDRCLLEVANLSTSPNRTTLVVEGDSGELRRYDLKLNPNVTERLILTLSAGAGPLRARIDDDSLDLDNRVVLLPEADRAVRVALQIRNEAIKELVEKALAASRNALLGAPDPELILTDDASSAGMSPTVWVVQIAAEPDAQSYIGPFVIDRSHALAQGLSLEGVVWAAGRTAAPAGIPVITAGDVPLLSDLERADGKHELRLRFRPDLSTLQHSPNWPILIWNLINWRASQAPGVERANVRLGSTVAIRLGAGSHSVEIRPPGDQPRRVTARDVRLVVKADQPGVWQVASGSEKFAVAANALSRDESDLTRCASGQWGDWDERAEQEGGRRSIAWVLLMLAMSMLGLHLVMAGRARALNQ